jgi:hypothetical protein
MKPHLEHLKTVLEQNHESQLAVMVEAALSGSEEDLAAFLVSDELWGGAGSIADQAGIEQDRDVRRAIEAALIELGEQQMRAGIVNVRTAMWVDAFRQWQRNGI